MIESGRAIEPKETRPSGDLARPPPLILDLDGTLIATDTLAETLLLYLKESPIRVVQALIWLSHGVAHLKRHLAAVVALDIDRLPVRRSAWPWPRPPTVRSISRRRPTPTSPRRWRHAFLASPGPSDHRARSI